LHFHDETPYQDVEAGSLPSGKEAEQDAQVQGAFASVNGSIPFLPFVISSFGGAWGQAADLVTFISRALAQEMLMPVQVAHTIVSNRVMASLMKFEALSLSLAVASHNKQHALALSLLSWSLELLLLLIHSSIRPFVRSCIHFIIR
jgi:hypothetical protein